MKNTYENQPGDPAVQGVNMVKRIICDLLTGANVALVLNNPASGEDATFFVVKELTKDAWLAGDEVIAVRGPGEEEARGATYIPFTDLRKYTVNTSYPTWAQSIT